MRDPDFTNIDKIKAPDFTSMGNHNMDLKDKY